MEALRRRQRLHIEGCGATTSRRPPSRRPLARVVVLAACLAFAAAIGLSPMTTPARVNALGPLPPCRYDDILTSPRQYSDWSVTLVDTILRVRKSYVPPDLVDVSHAGIPGKGLIRSIVIDDLRAMSEAAAAADAAIGVQSAYRSYETQELVFDGWVRVHGYERALELSARPGHSEHQLGLGIDFRSHPGGSPFTGSWARTAAGKWMKAHAWEYGFVMSYPRGKMAVVCYDFEPWHFRYVGREVAAQIRASGLTLREYLWANYTTAVVPAVTPPPDRTPKPSKPPAASQQPTPEPTRNRATTAPSAPPATVLPTQPATTAGPTASRPPVPTPSPLATPPGGDGDPVASLDVGLTAALVVALGGVIVLGWMVLRRGRLT